MPNSTLPALLLTVPWAEVPLALLERLLPVIRKIAQLIQQFRTITLMRFLYQPVESGEQSTKRKTSTGLKLLFDVQEI